MTGRLPAAGLALLVCVASLDTHGETIPPVVPPGSDIPVLASSFGEPETRITARLIEQVSSPDSSNRFLTLEGQDKALFLDQFWSRQNPLLHRYYFGYHLGKRRFTISDDFFEKHDLIPKIFHCDWRSPDSDLVDQLGDLTGLIVEARPKDPIALNARGYALLEADRSVEAAVFFLHAAELKPDFPEARNGWGLSYLHRDKRLQEALFHFRDAVASDAGYGAAFYNLVMCHLAMGSIDLGHRFGQVVT
jgi:tetratricopeptide (TPR) repeat protein